MAPLTDKTILIVGGSSGIGFAVAKASLASGARVVVASSSVDRVSTAVARLKAEPGGHGAAHEVVGETVDAESSTSIKELLLRVGPVDHLIWTSGDELKIGFPNLDLDSEAIRGAFNVRFWGPVIAAQHAKIKSGGSITLTVGSVVKKPAKAWSIVAGIAGAAESVTRGLAVDLAPVRVNVISPGFVKTELWKNFTEEQKNAMFSKAAEALPVKHVAEPEEIAEAYLFVMKCDYITGQRIDVDGGSSLA